MQDSEYSNSAAFRELLLAYLLEELPPPEREAVDERMLTDEDYSAALKDAECDLIDAYVADEIEGDLRDRVYRALIVHQPGKVELARAMQRTLTHDPKQTVDPIPRANPPQPVEIIRVRPQTLLERRWVLPALAAGLLIVATASIFLTRERSQHSTPSASAVAGQPTPAQPTPSAATADVAAQSTTSSTSTAMPDTVLTVILPAVVRGSGHAGTRISLKPQTQSLRIKWPGVADLPTEEAKGLQLQIADGTKVIATVPELSPAKSLRTNAVFIVPVATLPAGNYLFRIIGTANTGAAGENAVPQVYAENFITLAR